MKLKFTLQSPGGDVDLVATVDATATVGDLASHLARSDPARGGGRSGAAEGDMTLSLVGADRRSLDPRTAIGESGLFSGSVVALTRAGAAFVDAGHTVATVVITAGPDEGREYALPRGTAYIGRGRGCEVALSDGSVSRRHAKLVLSDVVEIVDLGSANGLTAGGQQVVRAQLRHGDVIRLGDTTLEVRLSGSHVSEGGGVGVLGTDSGVVSYSRSPRLAPLAVGREFQVPELPERPGKQPFPWISLAVPIIMAVTLYWITRNILSMLFLAMMPMMIVGTSWESRRTAKKNYERSMVEFREDLGILTDEIHAEHERERVLRLGEHPAGVEALQAIDTRGALLWTRRVGRPGFLELRFGLGTRPSRSTIEMSAVGRSKAEAWLAVSQELDGLGAVDGVPVVANPLEDGAIGVCGPRAGVLDAARSLVLQAAGLHSPADLVVVSFASMGSAHDWDFLKWLPHTTSVHSPLTARPLASTTPSCSLLADELEDLVEARLASKLEDLPLPAVLVLVEGDAPIDRSRLVELAERGPKAGVVVLWVAERQELLPAACTSFLVVGEPSSASPPASGAPDAGPGGSSSGGIATAGVELGGLDPSTLASTAAGGPAAFVGYVHEGLAVEPVLVDAVGAVDAAYVARRLAPVVDSGVAVDDDSDLPRAVSFLALSGTEIASQADAQIERWVESRSILTGPYAPAQPHRKPGNLRAIVGQSSQGALTIDLRSDGPHALVGGTTGAGKSELLQAWILGMASAHSAAAGHVPPRRLQGRVGLPRLREAAAHRRSRHRPLPTPRAPRARRRCRPSCAIASTCSRGTRPRTSSSSSGRARSTARRASSSSSTSSPPSSTRCRSSSTASSTSPSGGGRSGCTSSSPPSDPRASSRTTCGPTPTSGSRCGSPTRPTATTSSGRRPRPSSTPASPGARSSRPVRAGSPPSRPGMPAAGPPTPRRRPS